MNTDETPKPANGTSIIGEVAEVIPRLPKYAKLTWLLLKDPRLSTKQRAALMAAAGYCISPIDAIPGFIPVIGQLDDLAVILYTIRWVLGSLPPEQAESYLAKAGINADVLDDDFNIVKRNGVRVLKKMIAVMGWTALTIWAAGRFAADEIARRLRKAA